MGSGLSVMPEVALNNRAAVMQHLVGKFSNKILHNYLDLVFIVDTDRFDYEAAHQYHNDEIDAEERDDITSLRRLFLDESELGVLAEEVNAICQNNASTMQTVQDDIIDICSQSRMGIRRQSKKLYMSIVVYPSSKSKTHQQLEVEARDLEDAGIMSVTWVERTSEHIAVEQVQIINDEPSADAERSDALSR